MSNKIADVLLQGGLLVTGDGITRSDVLISEGKVVRIDDDLSQSLAKKTINANGKYVLPGGVDAHAHPTFSDKIDKMSICAAFGGVTTLICFVGNLPAWGYPGKTEDIVSQFIEEAGSTSILDVGVHAILTPEDEPRFSTIIPSLIRDGVISFKMFMTYTPRTPNMPALQMPDHALMNIMDLCSTHGGIAQVHCETGCCIDYLAAQSVSSGNITAEWHAPSQPALLEVEAVTRAATFASVTGCPLYPVHVSAKEIPAVIKYFQELGKTSIYAETCPHYLTLTNDEVLKKGPLAKVGPPLREIEDNEAMWQAVSDGTVSVIGSDSTGFSSAEKFGGVENKVKVASDISKFNIFEGTFGANTIEHMMPVIWSKGVNEGRITLPVLVKQLCENPAKIFGMYPKKGTVKVGSDADIVIWDPTKQHKVMGQHGNADFSTFEGFELLGMPITTMQRGQLIVEHGELVSKPGGAQYIPGDPNVTAYASNGFKIT
ncbi:MAG: dihydropyrimidinase [Chloroflexi bacterium]|nr:MAG: dihydropyrimidinase [Chloroflexota bacterium]